MVSCHLNVSFDGTLQGCMFIELLLSFPVGYNNSKIIYNLSVFPRHYLPLEIFFGSNMWSAPMVVQIIKRSNKRIQTNVLGGNLKYCIDIACALCSPYTWLYLHGDREAYFVWLFLVYNFLFYFTGLDSR